MNSALFSTYLIPILNAGSWLLGGTLITLIAPYELSTLRTMIVALALFLFILLRDKSVITKLKDKNMNWWMHQFVLSISGRVIYYYFGAKALLTISPFEAILLTSLLPVITILMEILMGRVKVSSITIGFVLLSCVMSILCIFTSSPNSNYGGLQSGHLYMLIAVVSFAFHTIYYKQNVKEASPQMPLAVQFVIASVLLLPFINWSSIISILTFTPANHIRFIMYAVVCGLLPFVCLHYALKKYSSFLVMTISILGPIFAILFKDIYQSAPISRLFVILTALTLSFTFLAMWSNQGFNKFWREKQP